MESIYDAYVRQVRFKERQLVQAVIFATVMVATQTEMRKRIGVIKRWT